MNLDRSGIGLEPNHLDADHLTDLSDLWYAVGLYKRIRRNDLNSSERMKCKQVRIASDDMCRASADGERKELIVFGITASRHIRFEVNPLRFPRQSGKKATDVFRVDVTAEFVAVENLEKLGEDGVGE